MAKFKVGDRVVVVNRCDGWNGTTGTVVPNGKRDVPGFVKIDSVISDHPEMLGGDGPAWFVPSQLTLLEPRAPKPKTIPARNLSGKHIGRVVTAESISGSVGVTATLEAVTQESEKTVLSFRNGGVFNTNPIFLMTIDPESEVVVNA